MLVTITVSKSGVHLLSMLQEDGHRLISTKNFSASFKVKDKAASDDVVEMYIDAPGLVSIKVTP